MAHYSIYGALIEGRELREYCLLDQLLIWIRFEDLNWCENTDIICYNFFVNPRKLIIQLKHINSWLKDFN